jgi:integrase
MGGEGPFSLRPSARTRVADLTRRGLAPRTVNYARAVLLTAGLRPSEALALRWSDLDLDGGELRVVRNSAARRTARRGGRGREDGEGPPVVPLVPVIVQALARHHDRQAVERLVAGEGYSDRGLVFADPRGGALRGGGMYKYFWLPMLRRLKLPTVRLYDARHRAATMLLEGGGPMKVVQEVLGHSSMAVTADVYSHLTPAFKRQAADALATYLEQTRNHTESGEGQVS